MSSDNNESNIDLLSTLSERLSSVAEQIASRIVEDAIENGTGAPTRVAIDMDQVAEAILNTAQDVPRISGMTITIEETTHAPRSRRRSRRRVRLQAPPNGVIKWKEWDEDKQCCAICGEKGNVQLICYGNISLCHHAFCEECIEQWFSSKAPPKGSDKVTLTCPTCRGRVCKTINKNGDIKRYRDYKLESMKSLLLRVLKAGGHPRNRRYTLRDIIPALEVTFVDHSDCNNDECILNVIAANPDDPDLNEAMEEIADEMMDDWEGRVTNIYEIKQNAIDYLSRKNKPWKKITGVICNAKPKTPTVDLTGYQAEVDTPQVVDIITTPTANGVVSV